MASERGRINGITEGVIWKQLLIFFFPIMLGTFFQQLYNTVDTVVVGRFVGTTALAAVGSTGSVNFLVVGFCAGVCGGFAIPAAQQFGAGDEKEEDGGARGDDVERALEKRI